MSQRFSVQYSDLRLRSDYPHIATEIHELEPHCHIIYAPKEVLDEASFAKTFDHSYRIIGDRVSFSNTRPPVSQLVPGIVDKEIGRYLASIPFTRSSLITVLMGKFPKLPALTDVVENDVASRIFKFEKALPPDLQAEVQRFLEDCLHGLQVRIVTDGKIDSGPSRSALNEDVTAFRPIGHRPSVPEFIAEEEHWWFENLEPLLEGQISPRSFTFKDDAGTACYLNTAMPLQMDFRQALLAYDTIYIEPPFTGDGKPSFWEGQSLTQEDLIKLVALDRVRILHSQPEERSDLGFLREAHEANPKGVIGRRRSAALMIADVVETADEYLLAQPRVTGEMPELIRRMAEALNTPAEEIARSLLYPVKARRECLAPLLGNGLLAYMSIGQGPAFADVVKRVRDNDVGLEAAMFGQAVHTAHLLDATLIPSGTPEAFLRSWLGPMQFMGERLNFYRSYNTRIAPLWAENERRKEKKQYLLPPIPLFEFHRNASLDDVLAIADGTIDRRKGRALISRLIGMSPEEQIAEIARLNEGLHSRKKIESKVSSCLLIDAALNVGAYFANLNLFPVIPVISILNLALECARKAPVLDTIIDEIETSLRETFGINEDVPFLSKVSRVGFLAPPKS